MTTEIPEFVQKVILDIKEFRIRSATTIAKACFETLEKYMVYYDTTGKSPEELLADYEYVGQQLVYARATEPMARNGLQFVLASAKLRMQSGANESEVVKKYLKDSTQEYLDIIEDSKFKIVNNAYKELSRFSTIYTHCNSTTAENILITLSNQKENFRVVADETRPRKQGRITATNLLAAGVDVTFIADTAAASVIMLEDDAIKVDTVIIGADEITIDGVAINQVGSLNIALAAHAASIPLYVVTPSLKIGMETVYENPKIEERAVAEVWEDAPRGIKIYNPVFEKVPIKYITGYICELGIITPSEFSQKVTSYYDWLVK